MTDLNPALRPRRGFGPGKIILVVLGGVAILGLALFFILKGALGPLVEAGDGFMGLLRDGNYSQAWAQAAPELQRVLGSPERLAATGSSYQPSRWSWSQRSVRNGQGYLSGSVTYRRGNEGTVDLNLVQVGGQWRVSGFRLN
jgi:hypothetical protein